MLDEFFHEMTPLVPALMSYDANSIINNTNALIMSR